MKKFLPVALAATMVFAAVGCSKTAETEAPEASETVIEESVVETSEVTEETTVETDETVVETESDIVKMWSDLGDVAREDLPEELLQAAPYRTSPIRHLLLPARRLCTGTVSPPAPA